jgi:pyruvate/2-oxoglutarate dehydrogenase complex dihydrolipoamide dehydrogenase (E3) component
MSIEHVQNLIIGSGVAGKILAWTLASQGQKTIVVERSMVGGSCPNVACLPSKNVIYSAKAVALVHSTRGLGVVTGSVRTDMAGVARRKWRMVNELVEMHLAKYRASGADLIMGEARFTQPKTVRVTLNAGGTRSLRGERVFIDVGTRASIPDVPGLATAAPMTHVEALNLKRLPEHLVILGGGYVGLEFAQAMRRFGSRVTIIQHGPRLLKREDPDVADALLELMTDEGIEVLLRAEVLHVTGRSGTGIVLRVRSEGTERTLQASDMLVAVGRTPNTDRLDAARAGVELDARGYIRVNDRLQTTAPDVWATGECAGSPQYTHVGEDDGRVVLDNLAGGSRTTRPAYSALPVHRPGAGPRRPNRTGGPVSGRVLPHRPDADGDGLPGADAVGDARVREGAHRRRRPHPGLHRVRRRGK